MKIKIKIALAFLFLTGIVLAFSSAHAATSGKTTFYLHKEPADKNETLNALTLTPPEPAADTASALTSTTNFAAGSLCESSNNTGETFNKVGAASATTGERCMASFISLPVGQTITVSTGDTGAVAGTLWSSESSTSVTATPKMYVYKWDGTTLTLFKTFTGTDPTASATQSTFAAAVPDANVTINPTDRIVVIVTMNVTAAVASSNVSIYFDSSARAASTLTLKYSLTAPNDPVLTGSKDDDFTTDVATTACSTAGVAYNTKWTCLQGTAASTAGGFNSGGTSASPVGDSSSWLWLKNQTTATTAVPSNFGATPSNTFLYQTLGAGYGDGVVQTVVNSSLAYTIGATNPTTPFSHTGIVLWTSNTDFLEVQVYSTGAKGVANTTQVVLNTSGTLGTPVNINSTLSNGLYNRIWIGFQNTGGSYQAQYSTDGATWNNLGSAVVHAAFTRVGLNAFARLANPVNTYAGAFEWFRHTFINPTITVGATGTQVASLPIGSTNAYTGGAFTMICNTGSANVTSITVTETGTLNANTSLANVKLLYDASSCTYAPTDSQFGSTTTFNASEKATFTGTLAIGTTQACFYVVTDVNSNASVGQTMDMQISNPSTDVVASAGAVSPATAVNIAGSTTIAAAGTLSVDIVDSGGTSVANPTVSFSSAPFNWASQQSTGTLGTSSAKIRVNNSTGVATWTLSVAAAGGNTSLWTSGSNTYDFNDLAANGRLQVDASSSTITPQSGCAATGISKGIATYFAQGTQDSISLLTASSGTQTACYWDLTGVNLTQDIPAAQKGGTYTLSLTLTAA